MIEKSAETPAGRAMSTPPLTVSGVDGARPCPRSPSKRSSPDTVSSCARSNVPPITESKPFTVDASTSPLAPLHADPAVHRLGVDPLAGARHLDAPFTLCAVTSFDAPLTEMPPFTVSARHRARDVRSP